MEGCETLPADPVRLKITDVNVLIRTWESETAFNIQMKAAEAVFIATTEYRDSRFITIESDRLTATAPGFISHFLIGFSDWGRPSFTTFVAHPELPLLICGCNNVVISVDVRSGSYRTAKLAASSGSSSRLARPGSWSMQRRACTACPGTSTTPGT